MMVALFSGFVAKENVVATLGVLFGTSEDGAGLTSLLRNLLSPAEGLAFLVVQMLFIPCVGTVGAIRQETNSWRWTVFSIILLLFIAVLGGVLTFQVVNWVVQ
jgi:ferrous iron transport protein B